MNTKVTPRELGYKFPAEWEPHQATWLSWPHNVESWPGKIDRIYPIYAHFIRLLSYHEEVHVNVNDADMELLARSWIEMADPDMDRIFFHRFPTNDAWCRDHGPAFVVNPGSLQPKAIVNWGYNAWGNKYPPYQNDELIPVRVAEYLELPRFDPGIIMEGGSIEVNGSGAILTSEACLLNPNRNPHLSRQEIEQYLMDYYGQSQVLWLGDGIIGDDTDGHVDDVTRFISYDTVLTAVESREADENHRILLDNLDRLKSMRLLDGTKLHIVEIPMPDPVVYQDQRLPASYSNFYIANNLVIVPTYRCKQDEQALGIIQECFPDREVHGLDSTDIIWGLGSFHCLSQQEPQLEIGP